MALNFSAFNGVSTPTPSRLNLSAFGQQPIDEDPRAGFRSLVEQIRKEQPGISNEQLTEEVTKRRFGEQEEPSVIRELKVTAPKTALNFLTTISSFAKTVQEEIARSGASITLTGIAGGVEALAPITSRITGESEEDIRRRAEKLREFDISDNPIAVALFGNRPLESIENRIAKGELNVQSFGKDLREGRASLPLLNEEQEKSLGEALERDALPLSALFIPIIIGLDFTGVGGVSKVSKALSLLDDIPEITKILRQVGIADDLIIPVAKKLAKETDPKIIEKALVSLEDIQKATKIVREAPTPRAPSAQRILGIEPAPFINQRETTLLRERISNLSRGAREGARAARQDIRLLQNEIIDIVNSNLPISLRGQFLKTVRNANNPLRLEKAVVKVNEEISSFQEVQRVLAKEGTEKNKIAFVKKVGDLNQTVVSDAKRAIGIDKAISKMSFSELESLTTELRFRVAFKRGRGFEPKIESRGTARPEFSEDIYTVNRETQGAGTKTFSEKLSQAGREFKTTADKLGGAISTRLKNIDPTLKARLRKYEFDLRKSTNKDSEIVNEFLKKVRGKSVLGVRKGGMTQSDFLDFDLATKNGDSTKIAALAQKYGFEKELKDIRILLDSLYTRANDVGFDVGYLEGYFPRVIRDSEGFIGHLQNTENWKLLGEAIQRKEMSLGRFLTADEKANLINNMIRGYRGGQITLSKTGAMKSRVIDLIDPKLNQFYATFDDSLSSYTVSVNEAIETRKFFGKELKGGDIEGLNNLEDSVGSFTADLLAKGEITLEQERELAEILRARFGEKGVSGLLGIYKNLGYIDTLGSPLNAITQLGDLAFALYKGGPQKAFPEALNSLLGKSKITKQDLGFGAEEIAAEVSNTGRVRELLDTVLRLVGFTKIDRMGLESLANSAVLRAQELAANPNPRFLANLEEMFPERLFGKGMVDVVLADFKSGQVTENVKYFAFNTVLDFSPRAASEMPEQYLRGGNGRIFYMLKTWTLKLFDVYRNEVWQEMALNKKQGINNLLRLGGSLLLMNATADEIKSALTGRKLTWKDRIVEQLMTLTGFSRYTLFQAQREGLGSAVLQQIIPPTPSIDDVSKDIVSLFKDFEKSADINKLKSVRNIPIGGDLYYWWFGKGVDIKDNERSDGGIQIPSIDIPSISIPSISIPSISI